MIAWTYLSGEAGEIFMSEIIVDEDTWLRARAWAYGKQHLSYTKYQIRTVMRLNCGEKY